MQQFLPTVGDVLLPSQMTSFCPVALHPSGVAVGRLLLFRWPMRTAIVPQAGQRLTREYMRVLELKITLCVFQRRTSCGTISG